MQVTVSDEKNKSSFKSSAWNSQSAAWTFVRDWWESPLQIRDKRKTYLEQFRKEPDEKYSERLNRSVPSNKFRETIETFAGMVFKDDPSPGAKKKGADEDATTAVPTAIANLFTDIDGCGNSLHSFLITAFEMFLRDGNAYFYIDIPKLSEDAQGKVDRKQQLTAADRENDRSFWVLYSAAQLINHRYETVNGRERLSLAVLEEKTMEPDGEYGEKEVVRHRILRPGSYVIEVQNEKQEWVEESSGSTGLDEIPLVSIKDIGTAPPLLELAMLNHQHYNKISDLDSWLHIACVPRQVIKFDSSTEAEKFSFTTHSVETGIKIFGANAEMFYLEPTGAGIEQAVARCDAIDAKMSEIGVGLLAPTQVGAKSATEVLDTAGQRQSKLARYAREFENAVEKAFYFTAEQENVIRPNSVDMTDAEKSALKLNMDFDRLTFDAEKMAIFERMNQAGKLSDLTMLEIVETVVDFPAGWNPVKELERLREQKAAEPEPKVVPLQRDEERAIG